MADLSKIISNITLRNGIWWCEKRSPVSYPSGGNQTYIQIEDTSFWFRHRNACIEEAVLKYGSKNMPFLDVGGGNGCVAKTLLKAGFETVMLEPDPAGITNAKNRGVQNLICASFEDCECIRTSVGGVGLFDVIEHIENDAGFLKRIRPLLHPEGSLFITVPAYPQLWSSEDIHDGHKRRYTMRSVHELLDSSGFSCCYATYFFRLLVGPIYLFRTLPHLLHLRRRQNMSTYRRENGISLPVVSRLLRLLFENELAMIRNKTASGSGASILAVAR